MAHVLLRKRPMILLLFALLLLMGVIAPTKAYAYTLASHKMGGEVWYQASSVFMDVSREHMREAMRTWNEHIPAGRRVCWDTAAHSSTVFSNTDGNNYIYKMSIVPSSALAKNTIRSNSSGIVLESDVRMNAAISWWVEPAVGNYDIQSCMLHEMGHTIGLDHSSYTTAVMYPTLGTGVSKRSLTTDDLNGLAARYV